MNAGAAAGLAIMSGSEAATLAGIGPFPTWNTPICWTGFILFADSVVYRARGNSWLRSHPVEFAWLALASIPLWLVFEFYNRFIENWHYVGLPENVALRYLGYAWSFGTIWPAIFEGAELIAVWRRRTGAAEARQHTGAGAPPPARTDADPSPRISMFSPRDGCGRSPVGFQVSSWVVHSKSKWALALLGAILLAWPLLWPSPYLAAPVWLGFVFLLDPINHRLGAESLLGDLEAGTGDRLKNLVLSGFLCGILWEFWNYWSRAKWHYTVPIMEDLKIFEMPVPGYFGFPAFALECFTMYVFVRAIVAGGRGRPIARLDA